MLTVAPIPCNSCSKSMYCSERCRQDDSIVHTHECGKRWSICELHKSATMSQSPSAEDVIWKILLSLRVMIVKRHEQNNNNNDTSIKERYRIVKSLLPHFEHHSHQEMRHLIMHSITAARIMVPLTTSTKTIDRIASRILLHTCQLKSNVYGITDLISDSRIVRQERIASAVYPICSLFNHSCDPNTSLFFNGATLTIRASRAIEVGGEVSNCYGPHYSKMNKAERQAILKQQYCFECHCSACSREDNVDHSNTQFKCPRGCDDTLKLKTTQESRDELQCFSCGAKASSNELLRIVSMGDQFYQKGRTFLTDKQPEKAYNAFKHACSFRSKVFHSYHKSVAETEDAMAESAALMGKFGDATDHVENSIKALRRLFDVDQCPPSAIGVLELGHEYFKLAQVAFNARRAESAMNAIKTARAILLNCVGGSVSNAPGHIREEIEELDEMERHLDVALAPPKQQPQIATKKKRQMKK
eukprot:TRINITY_DN4481_c0_g1_i2.p1 TRINITY_DN4481_c0_g1~~TRINITY_DN4481_c0_g1_i2.p1  ORF type:complete len:473 (-),score=60.23 TRINITY_DN4481_c0_g1_i2:128-1546(-)